MVPSRTINTRFRDFLAARRQYRFLNGRSYCRWRVLRCINNRELRRIGKVVAEIKFSVNADSPESLAGAAVSKAVNYFLSLLQFNYCAYLFAMLVYLLSLFMSFRNTFSPFFNCFLIPRHIIGGEQTNNFKSEPQNCFGDFW